MLWFQTEVLPIAAAVAGGRPEAARERWLVDTFANDCPAGSVDGTASGSGDVRLVTDAEGVIGIDHGALRIGQMVRPGWGRFGVAYGPFSRRPGRAAAVLLLNGHNLSQEYRLKEFGAQVRRWMRGSGAQPVWRQALNGLVWHRPRERWATKVWRWWMHRRRSGPAPILMRENLAVGFFGERAPARPLERGNALLVRAAEGFRNGQLCVGVGAGAGGRTMPLFERLQNVQVMYVVILRERGAAYYASGPAGAHGVGAFPRMRPVGIDAVDDTPELYAGVHQGVLGEIGFGIDSRVYGLKSGWLPELSTWFGTAQVADRLTAPTETSLERAEVGGAWRVEGNLVRSGRGAIGSGRAWIEAPEAAGLLHAIVQAGQGEGEGASLLWRGSKRGGGLRLQLSAAGVSLVAERGGGDEVLAREGAVRIASGQSASVQVLDDGQTLTVALDGVVLFGGPVAAPMQTEETGVGMSVDGGWAVRSFECHAREVEIPEELYIGEPWARAGGREAVRDAFGGAAIELNGRAVEVGSRAWDRTLGSGSIELTGTGAARVRASTEHPAPGRTLYTVPWHNPDFVDVEVELTPPGTGPEEGHKCRAGLCLWQDARNYVVVNIWLDSMIETTSVSSFFFVRGFEDLYDAAWTNVGSRHAGHGRPMRLRIVCDGARYQALVNDEPVLYRAFSDIYPSWHRLKITRVGLATTWEWGNDTGTLFRSFVARDEK